MSTQSELPLPASPAPRVLTIEQLRNLVQAAQAELEDSSPAMKASLAVLAQAAPASRLAALAALYAASNEITRRLIRTLRHLVQLLIDAEAHEFRQPGKARAVEIAQPAVAVAMAAALPISLSESQS